MSDPNVTSLFLTLTEPTTVHNYRPEPLPVTQLISSGTNMPGHADPTQWKSVRICPKQRAPLFTGVKQSPSWMLETWTECRGQNPWSP